MKQSILLLLAGVCLWGQAEQARITGTVADSTGGLIPNATINIKDSRTGAERQVTSDDKGVYFITNLAPSTYDITAKGSGLGPAEYKEIRLTVGQERTINIVLQPATVTTEVTVSGGELTQIDTSSARVGAEVNEREVANLPLNGRQISQ